MDKELLHKTLCLLKFYVAKQGDVELPRRVNDASGYAETIAYPGMKPGTVVRSQDVLAELERLVS
jgi:hypothetical protein